jgi:hypothetical protein
VNNEFVPLWVNVRTTPVPDVACMGEVLDRVEVDGDGTVKGDFSQGFFLRSVVLASDGVTLLNPQPGHASLGDLFTEGHFPYAQVKSKQYLPMLREALARARSLEND